MSSVYSPWLAAGLIMVVIIITRISAWTEAILESHQGLEDIIMALWKRKAAPT